MNTKTKTPRKRRAYHKITPAQIAEYKALKATEGNGTAAVRKQVGSTLLRPADRAYKLSKKADTQSTADFIDNQLQQIGIDAINRIGKLVNSVDEGIATRNSQYVVDHIRGQATKKSVTLTGKLNIQDVLD